MTRNMLYMPAHNDSAFMVNFDEAAKQRHDTNPYFVAGDLISPDGHRAFTTMVKTPFEGFHAFVDEEGDMKGLPIHQRASFRLYPGPLLGNILVMKMELVYTSDGPDWEVVDMPISQMNKILDLCDYTERIAV